MLLSVLAGTTPFERTASSSSLTKAKRSQLEFRVELAPASDSLELTGCGLVRAMVLVASSMEWIARGQSVHSHMPRQKGSKGHACITSAGNTVAMTAQGNQGWTNQKLGRLMHATAAQDSQRCS